MTLQSSPTQLEYEDFFISVVKTFSVKQHMLKAQKSVF